MLKQAFRCPICGRSMPNPEQLRIHRVKRHKGRVCGDDWLDPKKVVATPVQSQGLL